ncbi:MAG: class I SAM-dependent methyltransferase [Planctomycetales bacterium]|nr:class I SAM-dependent methyltransferase [Planctomycetales bacterium]
MQTKTPRRKKRRRFASQEAETRNRRKVVNRLVENDLIKRVSYDVYRDKVRRVYDGPAGAVLAACSKLSLHEPLGERLLKDRKFDLRGHKRILDVGSGAGQIAGHLLKYADSDAEITCFDLSLPMLRRARTRLKSTRPEFVAADLSRMPFSDGVFDCVTCGYVLEHLPDPRMGLQEISRVLRPGGRFLLLATEDSFSGAFTSRLWCCRTYNRQELRKLCAKLGLKWVTELWFTRMHRVFRAGGICVEIEKQ